MVCSILSTLSLIFPVHWGLVKALPRTASSWGLAFGEICMMMYSSSVVQWLYSTWQNYVSRQGNSTQWDRTGLEEGEENYNTVECLVYQLLGFMGYFWFFLLLTPWILVLYLLPLFTVFTAIVLKKKKPSQFLFCSSVP